MISTTTEANIPADASAAVFRSSEPIPTDSVSVQGPNFEKSLSLLGIGFQANSLGKAIDIVNKMVRSSHCFHLF